MFQLVVLITAREIDQQYEWSAHEPAGLRVGLEQSVIDVVKYDRDVTGLAEKDATVIRFLRALLREHKVSSELWAKMVTLFGRQRTIDIMMLMADYFTVGTMMNAVDQHLPPDRKALLPPRKRWAAAGRSGRSSDARRLPDHVGPGLLVLVADELEELGAGGVAGVHRRRPRPRVIGRIGDRVLDVEPADVGAAELLDHHQLVARGRPL